MIIYNDDDVQHQANKSINIALCRIQHLNFFNIFKNILTDYVINTLLFTS